MRVVDSRLSSAPSAGLRGVLAVGVDFERVFASLAAPHVVLSPELVVVAVNDAYCAVNRQARDGLVGRALVDSFVEQPDGPDLTGRGDLMSSLQAVVVTGLPHAMPVQRYDVQDRVTGAWLQRYWSIVNVPVLDDQGQVVLVVHRSQDISDSVVEQGKWAITGAQPLVDRRGSSCEAIDSGTPSAVSGGFPLAGSDVYAQVQGLQSAWRAESVAGRRLAGLVEVARHLSQAHTIADVIDAVGIGAMAALSVEQVMICRPTGAEYVRVTSAGGRRPVGGGEWTVPADHRWPAVATAATGQPVVLSDRARCLAWSPDMATLLVDTGCEAFVAVPVRVGAHLLGSLTVGWLAPRQLDLGELQTLEALANQCAQALERVSAQVDERRSAAANLSMAEALQRSLLTDPVQTPSLQICTRYVPAAQDAEIGGDWYDAFQCQDGSTWLVVGDVAGHDQIAAAVMAQVRNLLRGIAYTLQESPAAVLDAVDRAMAGLGVKALTTVVVMRVEQTDADSDVGVRRVRWANAGHPPPLLLNVDGSVTPLYSRAELLLGARPDVQRTDHEVLLPVGSGLLLYTDGLIERRNADLDRGLGWLSTAVLSWAEKSLDELCDELLDSVAAYADDDVALLALRSRAFVSGRGPSASGSNPASERSPGRASTGSAHD
ncbi:MAG: putative sensor protein [Modestobacter sp.]|nr:putative sensor protein [Modestobacter sp.]